SRDWLREVRYLRARIDHAGVQRDRIGPREQVRPGCDGDRVGRDRRGDVDDAARPPSPAAAAEDRLVGALEGGVTRSGRRSAPAGEGGTPRPAPAGDDALAVAVPVRIGRADAGREPENACDCRCEYDRPPATRHIPLLPTETSRMYPRTRTDR